MISGRRILTDLRLFGRGYLRNVVGLFFGLIFPVILILIFGAIFSGGETGEITVYLQNQDTGPFPNPSMDVATPFIHALNESGTLNVKLVEPSANFSQYLANQSSSEGVIIPSGFSMSYISGSQVNVTVYSNPAQSSSAILSGTVNGVINYFNLRYYNPNASAIIGVNTTTVTAQATNYIDFLIPGLVGFSILVNPMFSLVSLSSEYKKNKLFRQLSLTPLTKMEWLASKVLWYIFLSTLSFVLMVAVGVLAFGANVTLTIWLIPFLILGPMLFASLGMLVGTLTKNPETAAVIGNIVTFPMMFLAGTFFPIAIMPGYLQSIAHVLPLFYIVEGLNNVMVYGNISGALVDIGVVLVITLTVFVAAARLFRWRED
jgi:ABC-2 type transport system permease protein